MVMRSCYFELFNIEKYSAKLILEVDGEQYVIQDGIDMDVHYNIAISMPDSVGEVELVRFGIIQR